MDGIKVIAIVIVVIVIIIIIVVAVMHNNSSQGGSLNEQKDIPQEKSLYDRLGGIYAIAAVVNHFSDAVVNNPIAGKNSSNPDLKKWYAEKMDSRLPGLKWMRTLWLADQAGGPYKYVATVPGKCPMSLENAHKPLKISPEEFDAVAQELSNSLDHFSVPAKEKAEVLQAFANHKSEINQGYFISNNLTTPPVKCPFTR